MSWGQHGKAPVKAQLDTGLIQSDFHLVGMNLFSEQVTDSVQFACEANARSAGCMAHALDHVFEVIAIQAAACAQNGAVCPPFPQFMRQTWRLARVVEVDEFQKMAVYRQWGGSRDKDRNST